MLGEMLSVFSVEQVVWLQSSIGEIQYLMLHTRGEIKRSAKDS